MRTHPISISSLMLFLPEELRSVDDSLDMLITPLRQADFNRELYRFLKAFRPYEARLSLKERLRAAIISLMGRQGNQEFRQPAKKQHGRDLAWRSLAQRISNFA